MENKIVLVFSGQGGNDAIRGLMTEFGNSLISIGMSVVHVDMDHGELQAAADLAANGKVAFGLTYLGVGQDIAVTTSPGESVNLWEACRIPLLKIHGDIPAYYADRHRDTPSTAVNLYVADEFLRFRQRWLAEARTLAAVIPPMPLFDIDKAAVDVSIRKRGKLVFIKNGNSHTDLRRLWNERLSRSIAGMLESMAEAATAPSLKAKPFYIGDFVAESLAGGGIDPLSSISLVRFFTAQIDDYLRRVKSELIVTSLLDLPVIIQGGNWGHVDFAGRRAQLVPGQRYDDTRRVFTDALGILDMSPNTQGAPHERIWRAAGCFTLALTNRQGWLDCAFAEFKDLDFEFHAESIQTRVSDVIAHADRYLDLGISFGEAFRRVYPKESFANKIVDLAEIAMLKYANPKPSVQPFFVWSKID